MIPLSWEEIEALELGVVTRASDADEVRAVVSDTRLAGPGDLFVALNAGVQYVGEARARGASALVPRDQEAALAALARLVRSKSEARVVAVVGSVGKTTTKDVLGALCAPHARTIWADKSLNNEIGLPLTVCRLEPDTEVLVTEMGMRGLGQIASLCEIARPDVTIVSHIGPEHLELVATIERVAEANAEAIAALPPGGTAVVPASSSELEPFLGRDDVTIRRFDRADVTLGEDVTRFHLDGEVVELVLPFTQAHLAVNVLAALHAYAALGLPLERADEGVGVIQLSPWRGEEAGLPGGGFVINDAYNANPDSMRAALEHLAVRSGDRRKVAILGEMAELGDASTRYHEEIAELAEHLRIDVVGVGEPARAYRPVAWAPDAREAVIVAREVIGPGDAVLVKGSRAVALEGIAAEIANFARAWSPS